jgi:hypothetical protein
MLAVSSLPAEFFLFFFSLLACIHQHYTSFRGLTACGPTLKVVPHFASGNGVICLFESMKAVYSQDEPLCLTCAASLGCRFLNELFEKGSDVGGKHVDVLPLSLMLCVCKHLL